MNLNSENKQAIHEVMIADMQQRLYEQHNEIKVRNSFTIVTDEDYTSTLESLTEDVLHTNSVSDMNNVLCKYDDLFPNEYLTLDGTLNYVISLLVSKVYSLEQAYDNDIWLTNK